MSVELRTVELADWRSQVRSLLDHGFAFRDLHAAGTDALPRLRAAFQRDEHCVVLTCDVTDALAPSIVDLVPAASWDQREAAEHARLRFDGAAMAPLMDHAAPLDAWTTPVRGRDTHQVAVGPIHAGIIESGHFRFHVVGERVLHLDLRLFYNHRGIERAAQGRSLDEAIDVAARACAACTVANSVAYAQACEQASGLTPVDDVRRARTVLLELERVYNHLHDLSAACAGIGLAPGTHMFASHKERAQRVNHALTGHRFLFDAVQVGGSAFEVTASAANDARQRLRELRADVERSWRQLLFHGGTQNRLRGVGTLSRADAALLGVVGPAARASGLEHDARTHAPGLMQAGFEPATLEDASGDVRARIELRAVELTTSFGLLDELLATPIAAATCEQGGAHSALGIAFVESPRGRTCCCVEHDETTVTRLRLRTASYANWPAVALAATGEILPEFPLINKSFELCYACCDR
jgi:Ni,Fe-hydrogenase III large subunit